MPYALSILDKSPIPQGATAADAIANTVALARRAEDLGYKRFWVAEHHGSSLVATSAPEAIGEFVREANASDYRIEEKLPHVIADTPERIRNELDALAERFGVEEFIIDNPVPAFADRLASVELLGRRVGARGIRRAFHEQRPNQVWHHASWRRRPHELLETSERASGCERQSGLLNRDRAKGRSCGVRLRFRRRRPLHQ
jgi:hypothetical protein